MNRHLEPAPSIRFPVQPRLVPAAKAARFLHLTLDEFRAKLPELRAIGFPAPCPVTGHYDLLALAAWQDRRSGLSTRPADEGIDRAAVMRARIAGLG